MRALAARLGGDQPVWETAGFLHDIDLDITGGDMSRHGLVGADLLRGQGFDDEIIGAVLAHAGKKTPESPVEKALTCVDGLTGLIVSATLVLPTKKIADLTTESVLKRFREKRFAAGVNRELIASCDPWLSIPLEDFVEITLAAMQQIGGEIGL